ncbi:MAG: beta-1,6-N-acetylglucosaminyltransferase [Bacteroidales bacterium]|nr:beta-1,6-N-acetylglucosaminyltransferase [Bacteroidales bacterium]
MTYYLILFHKTNYILNKLAEQLQERIYLHPCLNLKKSNEQIRNTFKEQVVITDKRYKGNWGGFGIVEATIEGIRQILKEQPNCTHISLLSGVDYPIKPIKEYELLLANNPERSFIKYWDFYPFDSMESDTTNPWHEGSMVQKLRISRYYLNLFNTRYSIPPIENHGYFQFNFFQKFKHFIRFNAKGFTNKYSEEFVQFFYSFIFNYPREAPLKTIYGGSQWWSICRKHAEYIINYHDNNKKIIDFFRYTMLPDETYIQTILLNSEYKKDVINNNLRHINFEGNTFHPQIITTNHLQELKCSDAFFARKFDEKTDTNIIELIERELL